MDKIILNNITQRGKKRVLINFPYRKDDALDLAVRKMPGRAWSKTYGKWHIPLTKDYYETVSRYFAGIDCEIVDLVISDKNAKPQNTVSAKDKPKQEKKPIAAKMIIIRFDKKERKIYVSQPFDNKLYDALRVIESSYWDRERIQWVFAGTDDCFLQVKQVVQNSGYEYKIENYPSVENEETIPLVKYYIDSLRLKNYSPKTLEAYLPFFEQFVIHFGEDNIDNISVRQLQEYVKEQIEKLDLSDVSVRHLISSIKFYYEKILKREKIYFGLTKKYEIKPVAIQLNLDELLPFIEIMKNAEEKLLVLFKFHYGYTTEAICKKTILQVSEFLQNTSERKSISDDILKETLKAHLETINPKKFIFEKEAGRQIQAQVLEHHIYSIVCKFRIAPIYKYELNDAMMQAKFEETTRTSYMGCFLSFLEHFNYRNPLEITDIELREYLVEVRQVSELSTSYLNQVINVLNIYYVHLKKRKLKPGTFIRAKAEKYLPEILSRSEFVRMVDTTKNKKHLLVIVLLYSLGLRRQELIDLKIEDFDFSRNVVTVRKGKGNKDRQLAIPENLKELVIEYIHKRSSESYLIEGGNGRGKYSATSVENVIKDAAARAGIKKNVFPHILRHSIATHMIEQGIDVSFVKEFLGHESIKTTMRYTHLNSESMQKVRNPFDSLKFGNSA